MHRLTQSTLIQELRTSDLPSPELSSRKHYTSPWLKSFAKGFGGSRSLLAKSHFAELGTTTDQICENTGTRSWTPKSTVRHVNESGLHCIFKPSVTLFEGVSTFRNRTWRLVNPKPKCNMSSSEKPWVHRLNHRKTLLTVQINTALVSDYPGFQ